MALRTMLQHAAKVCTSSLPALGTNSSRALSSKYVNNVELLGRVGREPQRIGDNDAIAFPLYTENVLKFKDGTVKTYPCWHRILVLKKNHADVVFNQLERGQRCYVSGRIAYRAAEPNADGKMVYNHQAAVVAQNVIFLEKSRRNQSDASQSTTSTDLPSEAMANN